MITLSNIRDAVIYTKKVLAMRKEVVTWEQKYNDGKHYALKTTDDIGWENFYYLKYDRKPFAAVGYAIPALRGTVAESINVEFYQISEQLRATLLFASTHHVYQIGWTDFKKHSYPYTQKNGENVLVIDMKKLTRFDPDDKVTLEQTYFPKV